VTRPAGPGGVLIIVPAFNEEGAIAGVVRSVEEHMPGIPVLVIDDGSVDATIAQARAAGAEVLTLPHHLGLGAAVQTGYKLAYELGFEYVIRIDGDGQHDARDIPRILEKLQTTGCEMVIGSRFVSYNGSETSAVPTSFARGNCARRADGFTAEEAPPLAEDSWNGTSLLRALGIRFFRLVLQPILGKPVHDPTSGFVGVNRRALAVFGRSFPLEYPEIEALVVLQRRRFRFEEIPCKMRPRTTGRTSITPVKSLYYIAHVLLGVFVNVLKYERRLHRRGGPPGAPGG
jgi:glycosyltransferase involved in cell wall biosynthesis